MAKKPIAPPAPAHPDVEIADVKVGHERHLRVEVVRFRHRLFGGGWSGERTFDIVRRGEAVAVVLYDPERDSIVLIEQFRLAALLGGRSPWQIEVVAGLVDGADETPLEVALRETREETSLVPIGPLIPIQTVLPAAGSYDEAIHLFCGRVDAGNAAGIHGLPEEQEDIRVLVKTTAEVEAMLDAGEIDSGHAVICLYWLVRHRDRLRKEWLGE